MTKNLHVTLPDELDRELRSEAKRSGRPATRACEGRDTGVPPKTSPPSATRRNLRLRSWFGGNGTRPRRRFRRIRGREPGVARRLMRRGEVYRAELRPRSGSVQRGSRPVIVVSHDAFNRVETWRSIIVVPVSASTKQSARGPTSVALSKGAGGLAKDSVALCHQVTTLDRAKLKRKLGTLMRVELNRVEQGLKASLDID